MALYDLFNKDKTKKKPAKKAANRKDKLAALDERISRGYRKPVAGGRPSSGASPRTTKVRASSTSPAPKPRTTKVRGSSTSPAPKPRTTKVRRGPILRTEKAAPKKAAPKRAAPKKTSPKSADKKESGGFFSKVSKSIKDATKLTPGRPRRPSGKKPTTGTPAARRTTGPWARYNKEMKAFNKKGGGK
mgnify:CR=1 FL=1|tara:strand:- start:88 stop:651 length:564 start_codon:yes stop_codon:yes gene_type:complete